MELRLQIEPQFGATYEQQLTFTRAAEELGFAAMLRADHFVNTAGGDGLPGPTDAWVTLGALARETTTIRLGTLVTSVHFRAPGLLAVSAAQVDEMSGGRLEIGIGAGWFEREHVAFGFPFPPIGERLDRLEEQIEILTGMWATPVGETFTFTGRHYQLEDCPGLPKPFQQPHPPIICGGYGTRRTPSLTARFADEFNIGLAGVAATAEQFQRVRAACEELGRDPDTLVYSASTTVSVGATTAEAHRRVEAAGATLEEVNQLGIAGTPAEVIEHLHARAEVGAQRCYLRVLDITDLDHLALIAAEIMPHA